MKRHGSFGLQLGVVGVAVAFVALSMTAGTAQAYNRHCNEPTPSCTFKLAPGANPACKPENVVFCDFTDTAVVPGPGGAVVGGDCWYNQDDPHASLDDVIAGSNFDDTISAGDGSDVVCGNGGNDVIAGGYGQDDLYGGAGDDVISGDEGDDSIRGNSGNDVLLGGSGFDYLNGGPDSDRCIGGADPDFVSCETIATAGTE